MFIYISSLLIFLLFFQIDTNLTSQYILITEEKTWSEAQRYCQKNHKDLASVWGEAENNTIQNAIQNNYKDHGEAEKEWKAIQKAMKASSLHFN